MAVMLSRLTFGSSLPNLLQDLPIRLLRLPACVFLVVELPLLREPAYILLIKSLVSVRLRERFITPWMGVIRLLRLRFIRSLSRLAQPPL